MQFKFLKISCDKFLPNTVQLNSIQRFCKCLGFNWNQSSCFVNCMYHFQKRSDNCQENNQNGCAYKHMKIHCKLLHAFDVIERGFSMKQPQIEEFFYDGRLRINKERVGKRYAKIRTDDIIDLIVTVTEDDVTMKRIKVVDIETEKNSSGNWIIVIKRWKHLKLKRIFS